MGAATEDGGPPRPRFQGGGGGGGGRGYRGEGRGYQGGGGGYRGNGGGPLEYGRRRAEDRGGGRNFGLFALLPLGKYFEFFFLLCVPSGVVFCFVCFCHWWLFIFGFCPIIGEVATVVFMCKAWQLCARPCCFDVLFLFFVPCMYDTAKRKYPRWFRPVATYQLVFYRRATALTGQKNVDTKCFYCHYLGRLYWAPLLSATFTLVLIVGFRPLVWSVCHS